MYNVQSAPEWDGMGQGSRENDRDAPCTGLMTCAIHSFSITPETSTIHDQTKSGKQKQGQKKSVTYFPLPVQHVILLQLNHDSDRFARLTIVALRRHTLVSMLTTSLPSPSTVFDTSPQHSAVPILMYRAAFIFQKRSNDILRTSGDCTRAVPWGRGSSADSR